jgi:hypothetical protein
LTIVPIDDPRWIDIPAKARKAFKEVNVGLIDSQPAKANCNVENCWQALSVTFGCHFRTLEQCIAPSTQLVRPSAFR